MEEQIKRRIRELVSEAATRIVKIFRGRKYRRLYKEESVLMADLYIEMDGKKSFPPGLETPGSNVFIVSHVKGVQ